MNAIMVFNIFYLIILPIYVHALYKFEKKGYFITVGIYFLLIWLPRFIASLAYIYGSKKLRDTWFKPNHEWFKDHEKECESSDTAIYAARTNPLVFAYVENKN